MTESSGSLDSALLARHIETIANIQGSIQELQREIGQLRQDARADGFNMEAVYHLAILISKSPHDGGTGLIKDILHYARQTNIDLDLNPFEDAETIKANQTSNQPQSIEVSAFLETSPLLNERFSLLTHLTLGIVISALFIWLLH